MAATERRVGPSRRGMTVLGKVPVVPKPVNLPSQRLENQGLFRDVDIVPRGTCSWGSAGRFPGVCSNKSRNSDSASSNPLNSGGEQENARKVESKPVSETGSRNAGVKDGGGLLETSVQFSSAKTTTGQALDSTQKIEGPRNSNSYTCDSLDSQKQENTKTPLQNSGDGYVHGVSVPPGFGHCGSHSNQSRAGVSAPDLQCNGIGAGMYPNISQQNGLHSFPGVPHQNGKKEREIIVIHMVGNPGFYGNYPPQLGYPETYRRNGLYGNFPLQFGNFEPYFGFQGHGRLDGGPQMSTGTGSDVFDEHEDFICYEKECYQGRKKNGLVRGSFQESTSVGGAQRDVHEAIISHSSLKPRCVSQKHSARNIGRLRSLYHNGRLVPIEEACAVPVPEKRITLLTKVSQPKRLTIESLDETGVSEVAHAEEAVGSALSACGDEGKAPETCEADLVNEEIQVEKLVASASLKVTDEISLPKETELGSDEVSALATTCNDKCLHCKAGAAALEGPALMVCQACKKATECENTLSASQCCLRPTKEVPSESIDVSNSTDGCTVEVKHVIFDSDSSSSSTVKGQEDSSLSSSMQDAAADKQLDTMILKKSLKQNNQEGKSKLRLLGTKGITDGKWKPKRPVGAAKVDFKVLAPKIRKAAGRKNTPKTFSGECVSEASSSTMYNKEDSGANMVADSMILPSQTETCNKCQESSSPSSLSSKGNVPVDDSQELIASQGHRQKKKGRSQHKTTPKDCYDNVENLVKAVFEDISNTEVQKQEPKGADITKEKAWRPKLPTALQSKSATKVSGIQVNKAHVIPQKIELQGGKSSSVFGSTCSADSSEAAKEDGNAVQKSNCLSTSQLCSFVVICQNNQADTKSSEATSKYHMIRRRVYHVVEGSGGDYFIPAPTISGKLYPKGNYRSLQTTSMQNQEKLSKKKVLIPSGSSCTESEHSEEFSEFMSVVDIKSHRSQSISVSRSEVAANQCTSGSLLSSSGFEKSKGKKHIRRGERLSAWKPKTTSEPAVLQKVFQKKDKSRSGTLISAHAEGASKEIKDLASSSQVSTSSNLHTGESNEELRIENVNGLPLELESVNHQPFEEVKYSMNQEDTPPIVECKEILDCQNLSETMFPMEEVDHGSVLKYVEELPTLVSSLKEEVQVQQTTQICSQENAGGSCRPFEEVKYSMNQEDTPLIVECKEVLDSQNLSETMVPMEEVDHGPALKHVEELPTLVSSLKEEVQVQQTTQICSQDNAGGSHRPFEEVKYSMNQEDTPRIVEYMEVQDSQNLSETMVPMEEVDHGSVLKHVEELPTLVSSLKEEVQVQQTTQICSWENTGGSRRPSEEVKYSMNQEDTPQIVECKEELDSQNLSETMVPMEEVDHGSVLKHVEELPTLLSSLKEEVQVQQISQTCSQENTGGSCRPFFKKKNVMSYEKANRYHQMMFKKYKETGHWKPKADRHGKLLVEKDCASQNSMEVTMNSVLVIA